MSDSYINVPNQGVGAAKVKTFDVTDAQLNEVEIQGVALVDPATGAARGPLTDAELRAAPVQVTGQAANGGGAAGNPMMVAGSDSGIVRNVAVDSSGRMQTSLNDLAVSGSISALNGAVELDLQGKSYAAVLWDIRGTFGGSYNFEGTVDGTNWVAVLGREPGDIIRNFDRASHSASGKVFVCAAAGFAKVRIRANPLTSGTMIITGRAAQAPSWQATSSIQVSGVVSEGVSAVNASPISVAGKDADGTQRMLKTDTDGRQVVVGGAAIGSAIVGNPVVTAGRDYNGNARAFAMDLNGRIYISGEASPNGGVPGSALSVGGSDGSNFRVLRTDNTGALAVGNSAKATYVASIHSKANTSNVNVIAIEAGASKTVRICRVVIVNPGKQTTAGLRVLTLVRTIAAGAGGFLLTPARMQTTDAAFSGIVRESSGGTDGESLMSIPVFVPSALETFEPLVIDFEDVAKRPTIEPGTSNGITLKDPGASGASDFAAYVVFTEE